ncbi:MAG TPA: protein kinase [Polyangiaceae bacterium]|jgi:serine/threonine protein kinase|nr:protein kinase [Polyangiaceae bacterium]
MAIRNTPDAGAPKLVGRYELLSPVLSGALGELWQARIASGPEEGRFVDIRRIPRSDGLEMRDVERLTNAGFAAMELRHPRVAAVLDVVVGAAEIAIVSEHIAGALLQCLVRPEPGKRVSVPIGVAARVSLDLLEAIDAVRAPWGELFPSVDDAEDVLLKSCVHGGLLPDGLLVASFGETMLLEAGLAGVALTIPTILDHPDVIAYRAPEQLEPGRTIDERADVFTVGVLLWEMITGRSLFGPSVLPRPMAPAPGGKSGGRADPVQVSAARRKVLSQPIPRLDALPLLKGKVPKELADCVARCLERDPSLRFQTVRDAIRTLSVLDGESLSRHDRVGALIVSLGIAESREPKTEESEGPTSDRPTSPPVEETPLAPLNPANEGVTRSVVSARRSLREPDTEKSPEGATRDLGPAAASHAAKVLADAESVAANADFDSFAPPAADAPVGVPAETIPPSSADLDTLPPLAAVEIARAQIVGTEGSVTLMSGVAPPEPVATIRDVARAFPAPEGTAGPSRSEPVVEEETSAPVVRALDSASSEHSSAGDAPVEDPVFSGRRDGTRKVVVYVMAGAALLVVIAALRFVFSSQGSDAAAPSMSSAVVATTAVTSVTATPAETTTEPPPLDSAAAATNGAGATATARAADVASPTSTPTVATPGSPDVTGHKPSGKKRPYRPSGI